MALRLYLSKVRGDGVSIETAYRPAFSDLLPGKPFKGTVDGRRSKVAFIVADVTNAEHTLLIDSNEVREVPAAILGVRRVDLTPPQATALGALLTLMGYADRAAVIFTNEATVMDILRWVFGNQDWDGWRTLGV